MTVEFGAWFFFDVALKSGIVLLAAWGLTLGLRRASAASRHWVWSLAMVGLLVLPALSYVVPEWRIGLVSLRGSEVAAEPAAEADGAASAAGMELISPESRSIQHDRELVSPVSGAGASGSAGAVVEGFDWGRAAFGFWMVGLGLIALQMAGASFRVRRLARSASPITDGVWVSMARQLAARLRLRARVALFRTGKVTVPMTWGALRSVVMLPEEAETWSEECRRIVLLHELAHIKRRDCLTQNLAQLACALYWFNPLVWMAARRLRVERELACDDQVLAAGAKASDYAGHLVEIARSYRANRDLSAVSAGMACSQLESRVRSILDPSVQRRGLDRRAALLIGVAAAGFVFCLAAVKPWGGGIASFQTSVAAAADSPLPQASPNPRPTPQPSPTPTLGALKVMPEPLGALPTPLEVLVPLELDEPDSQTSAQSGGANGQRAELTVDQIVKMKTHDVTAEFIESIRRAGFENLALDEIIRLRMLGIDEAFIRQARSWQGAGAAAATMNEIVQLKVSGVTSEYIEAMKRTGYDNLSIRQLARLRIHGVTPEYVESLRRNGYDKLTAEQIASLKTHGIDEAFIRETQAWTGGRREIKELLQLRIHGVTPEYARGLRALGLGDLPIEKLTAMKIHGVNEAYVREMRDLGFDKLTGEQLLRMRIHGVTADYVRKLRAAGLKNVSVDQMIDMKVRGIDSILLKGK
ncbi:MAG: M56 family metallopeptidase [Blastocatellia bacterium]|nr:M56 family metallopeptidase [Blastocatellia bacterium]